MKKIIAILLLITLFLSACSKTEDGYIVCSNCNEQLSEDSRFCSSCGVEITLLYENDITDPTNLSIEIEETDELNFDNINTQLNIVKAIFDKKNDAEILNLLSDGSLSDDGNILIDGRFSTMNGSYEIYCWNNHAYQIVFRWDNNQDISSSDIVSDISSYIGEHTNYNEYWDIYEWEIDDIEITYKTEDGVWIEQIFNKDLAEPVITEYSITESDYLSMSQADVEDAIATIRQMMSYRKMPKEQVFLDYPTVVDDDWNQLLMPGDLLGIEGQYVFMYDKKTGIVYSVAFDWIPDDMEKHEEHIVSCLNMYFGDCTDVHDTEFNGEIYYYHDWDATTIENWSVHLSMRTIHGWLQFSQLKAEKTQGEEYTCIECGKKATNTYNNPFSKQEEYYCSSHYKEIIDIFGEMEADVGNSDYSKHTCMECSREGTHQYKSFTGQIEYYCTQHYEELMNMLEELGID